MKMLLLQQIHNGLKYRNRLIFPKKENDKHYESKYKAIRKQIQSQKKENVKFI